jgi:hypothetical protein
LCGRSGVVAKQKDHRVLQVNFANQKDSPTDVPSSFKKIIENKLNNIWCIIKKVVYLNTQTNNEGYENYK